MISWQDLASRVVSLGVRTDGDGLFEFCSDVAGALFEARNKGDFSGLDAALSKGLQLQAARIDEHEPDFIDPIIMRTDLDPIGVLADANGDGIAKVRVSYWGTDKSNAREHLLRRETWVVRIPAKEASRLDRCSCCGAPASTLSLSCAYCRSRVALMSPFTIEVIKGF